MTPQEIIRKKRQGQKLTDNDLMLFFNDYLKGNIKDYQVSALLMAIFLQGMTYKETAALTKIMRDSGKSLSWKYPKHLITDKHSTGGIGDKTSIILLPLCASEGVIVPMISGRGLGHSGGTLDKLESIPGMDVRIDIKTAKKVLDKFGGVFMGQTSELAPLDKKLYSLRDVTATIESIPLITASILSKKTVEGISNLVMDVKFGSGAFMQTRKDALKLARTLVKVGTECGLNISSFLTSMNSPLGRNVGNQLEIMECIEILKGSDKFEDTKKLTLALTEEMVALSYPKKNRRTIRNNLEKNLKNGKAYELFLKIVNAQKGSTKFIENIQTARLAKYKIPVFPSKKIGVIEKINVRDLGLAVLALGGGRKVVTDKIDPLVGLSECKHLGESINEEPVAIIHANNKAAGKYAKNIILKAYKIGTNKTTDPLIWKKI